MCSGVMSAAFFEWSCVTLGSAFAPGEDAPLGPVAPESATDAGSAISNMFAGLPPWAGPVLSTLALIVGVWIVVSQMRGGARGRRGRVGDTGSEASPRAGTMLAADVDQLRSLQQDMDRLLLDLDARSTRLEGLIVRAEQRIGELERVLATPARETIEAKPRGRVMTSEPQVADPIHQQVYQLRDAGYAPVDIARRLQQPTGQVELILALRGR